MGTSKFNKKRNNYTNVSNIHKYNNFLTNLDKKSEEINIKNYFGNDNNKSKCKEDCTKNSNKTIEDTKTPNLESSFFTGTRGDDLLSLQLENRNPNKYIEIKSKVKQPKLSLKIPTNSFF